ncbi:MAG: cytochrome biosis protein, partial [Flaviaesturariibacter sp.]|nr:cytochrome biosis protein [Flaviaesturariibacter sp.]
MQKFTGFLCALFLFAFSIAHAQGPAPYSWQVAAKRLAAGRYELTFTTRAAGGWQLYAPDQVLSDVPAAELQLNDSSVGVGPLTSTGKIASVSSAIFEGSSVRIETGAATWKSVVTITGDAPPHIQGTLLYTYGNEGELYPSTSHAFSVPLEGGVATASRIKV